METDDTLLVQIVDDELCVASAGLVRQRILQRGELRMVHINVVFAKDLFGPFFREPCRSLALDFPSVSESFSISGCDY